jgi:putative phosphoribosyl transferase
MPHRTTATEEESTMKLRRGAHGKAVVIPADPVHLTGNLFVPDDARGLVVFAHGSGSSRLSPRNRHVAEILNGGRLATLLFDLLTPDEEIIDMRTRELRFDIPLLSWRLVQTVDWVVDLPEIQGLDVGLFGASTGAAAALIAAAERPGEVVAVVSRGGRCDLAGDALRRVRAPTLMIVGSEDYTVIDLNHEAEAAMLCETELRLVQGATHLFEEPGTLDQVAAMARDWFVKYLASTSAGSRASTDVGRGSRTSIEEGGMLGRR